MVRFGNPKPQLSWRDRVFWVCLRQIWSKWRNALMVHQPETVVRWHRHGFRVYWRMKSGPRKKRGRPPIKSEIRELIRCMAEENSTWGAPHIHGELLKLGFSISERTVSRYLSRIDPDQPKAQNWLTFLHNHREAIAAMDFFTIPTVTFSILYGFFVIHFKGQYVLWITIID